jgi:hypothetical protein
VMFVLACLPLTATGSLIVTAHGYTIGTQGEKPAAVTLAGGDPSVIAIQSIQSGDSPLYPNFPVHIEASLLGSGAAKYGALAASLEAQVKNLAAIPNLLEPEATGILRMSFADQGLVVSGTKAVGEEVDLDFYFALSSDFIDTGSAADPTHNGATVEFNGTAKDTTSGAFVKAVIVNGSPGTTPSVVLQTLHTAVSRVIDLTGNLDLGVGARAPNESGGNVIATSAVLASHTGRMTYLPQANVQLISNSGHDYSVVEAAVPEPDALSLAVLGIGAMAIGRCVSRRVRRRS